MFVGVYRIELHIPASQSLKAKRSVVNGIKARLVGLNMAVAEVDGHDLWQRATLGATAVANEPGYLDDLADRVSRVVERDPRVQLLRVERDVRPVEF